MTLPSIFTILKRSFFERCPNCGQAPLFYKYLKQVDQCPVCAETWGRIRADDGPAWLTVLITGHVIVPLALHFESNPPWPGWVSLVLWPALALLFMFWLLPRAKALFIGLIWKLGAR
jgi:uncharacterized protein (DUF983 family)